MVELKKVNGSMVAQYVAKCASEVARIATRVVNKIGDGIIKQELTLQLLAYPGSWLKFNSWYTGVIGVFPPWLFVNQGSIKKCAAIDDDLN